MTRFIVTVMNRFIVTVFIRHLIYIEQTSIPLDITGLGSGRLLLNGDSKRLVHPALVYVQL